MSDNIRPMTADNLRFVADYLDANDRLLAAMVRLTGVKRLVIPRAMQDSVRAWADQLESEGT